MDGYRKIFPIFAACPDLVYLDSAATALKPQTVIDTELEYYASYSSNVHRGLYPIAQKATEAVENVRESVREFIHAKSSAEIIFTKNATEGINVIASCIKQSGRFTESEIVVTVADHHSNFVPWQQAAKVSGARFVVADAKALRKIESVVTAHTSVLSLPLVTNVTGEVLPIADIVLRARAVAPGIIVVVDACQAAAHIPVDVGRLGCDFLVFSGHKLYGPTGVGVLYGREALLKELEPYQYGGDMIHSVRQEATTWNILPYKYEAGTLPIAQIIALGEAIRFITKVGYENITNHDHTLGVYCENQLREVFGARLQVLRLDSAFEHIGTCSFAIKGVHPHDIAQMLGQDNICIRAGHHCAQPLHDSLMIGSSCRISFGVYNAKEDIDRCIAALQEAVRMFG